MRNIFLKRKFIALLIIVSMAFIQPVFARNEAGTASRDDLDYLAGIMDMIKNRYNGQVTDRQLIEGAVKGM